VLTPEQTALVDVERKKIKEEPGHFIDWDEARKTLNLDYCRGKLSYHQRP